MDCIGSPDFIWKATCWQSFHKICFGISRDLWAWVLVGSSSPGTAALYAGWSGNRDGELSGVFHLTVFLLPVLLVLTGTGWNVKQKVKSGSFLHIANWHQSCLKTPNGTLLLGIVFAFWKLKCTKETSCIYSVLCSHRCQMCQKLILTLWNLAEKQFEKNTILIFGHVCSFFTEVCGDQGKDAREATSISDRIPQGSQFTPVCDECHTAVGRMTCQWNGTWTGREDLSCLRSKTLSLQLSQCHKDNYCWLWDTPSQKFTLFLSEIPCFASNFLNGVKDPDTSRINCGETVTYSCNEGFVLSGESVLTCESSGWFSSRIPTCVGE